MSVRFIASGITMTALAATALGGCATNDGYMTPNTGVALEQAYAKQIIDPNPVAGPPAINPEKAQAAIERYLADQIKDPSPAETGFIITD